MTSYKNIAALRCQPTDQNDRFYLLDDPVSFEGESADHQASHNKIFELAGDIKNQFDALPKIEFVKIGEDWKNKERESYLDSLFGRSTKDDKPENTDKAELRGSVTCAVTGAWGAGKTTFLAALKRQFEEPVDRALQDKGDKKAPGNVTVWFEPWRYEREKNLIIPLMVEFTTQVYADIATLKSDDQKRAILDTGKKLVGRLARDVFRTAGKVAEHYTGFDPYEVGEEVLKRYGEMRPDWSDASSEVTKFRDDFEKLVARVAVAGVDISKPRSIVVFVDDLDRCDPEQVKRLLEALKLFLQVPGITFFLAIDETQVLRAIGKSYRNFMSEADASAARIQSLAKRYLEKFFQFTIDLSDGYAPVADSILDLRKEVWCSLIKDKFNDNIYEIIINEKSKKIEKYDDLISIFEKYAICFRSVKANPRAIKSLARWLHIQLLNSNIIDGAELYSRMKTLLPRFAEEVISINFGYVWVNELSRLQADMRATLYAILFNMLTRVFGPEKAQNLDGTTAVTTDDDLQDNNLLVLWSAAQTQCMVLKRYRENYEKYNIETELIELESKSLLTWFGPDGLSLASTSYLLNEIHALFLRREQHSLQTLWNVAEFAQYIVPEEDRLPVR